MERGRSEKLPRQNPTIIFRYKSFAGLSCFLVLCLAACRCISLAAGRVIPGRRLRVTPREPPSFGKPAACSPAQCACPIGPSNRVSWRIWPPRSIRGSSVFIRRRGVSASCGFAGPFVRRGPREPRRSRGRRNCNRRSRRGDPHGTSITWGTSRGTSVAAPCGLEASYLRDQETTLRWPNRVRLEPCRRLLVGRRERRRVGNRRDAGIRPTAWRVYWGPIAEAVFLASGGTPTRHCSSADRCRSTCVSRGATAPAVQGRTLHPRSTSRWQASLRHPLPRGGGLRYPSARYGGWRSTVLCDRLATVLLGGGFRGRFLRSTHEEVAESGPQNCQA